MVSRTRENPVSYPNLFVGKVPALPGANQTDIYFNPITESFRKKNPNVVRGGFIGSGMGLGKT
jgi:hypothetical protein